ncbi:MAG: hypothetical protein ACYC6N_16885, partial [Pirellulaceae bacterium]
IHDRQGLLFGLEAGDHLSRIHAQFDDFQSHSALHRLGLLGHEDRAHATFADLLQKLVAADLSSETFLRTLVERGTSTHCWLFQKVACIFVKSDQLHHSLAQLSVRATYSVEESGPFRWVPFHGRRENGLFVHDEAFDIPLSVNAPPAS